MNQAKLITMATLESASLQEIYNQVSAHLLRQKTPASVRGVCVYKADDGTKCAIGCLISDSEYSKNVEHKNIAALVYYFELYIDYKRLNFLKELQLVHDVIHPVLWEESLRKLAVTFGLNPHGQ
jgi:hypothetical protein